jgi:hypothetical protein
MTVTSAELDIEAEWTIAVKLIDPKSLPGSGD